MTSFKSRLVIFVVLLFIASVFGMMLFYTKSLDSENHLSFSYSANEFTTDTKVIFSSTEVLAQTPQTREAKEKGLGGRASIPENTGMLFVVAGEGLATYPTFWMKGMQFDLDFIWIHDGEVVDITKDVPPPSPNTPERELTRITPKQAVDSVLEVNAGFVDKHGIKVGDTLTLQSL